MCDVNKTLIFKRIKTLSKMAKDINKNKKESMNYIHCCTELLCVNGNVDGLKTGNYYKELYRDRTHVKVLDEYGIESMYYSDRFIKSPSKQ